MPGVASTEWEEDSCQLLGPAGPLLLTQPKVQLAITATKAPCWLTVSLLPSRTPKAFSASIPAPMRAGACSCSCPAEFPEAPLSPFLQLMEVPVDGSTLSAASAPAPVCTTSKLAVEHFGPESMSFMKMLNSISTSPVPESALGAASSWKSPCWSQTTGLALQSVLNPPHCPLNYFVPHLPGVYLISVQSLPFYLIFKLSS